MTDNTVYMKIYPPEDISDIDRREIWRYSGCPKQPEEADELNAALDEVIDGLSGDLTYKVCWLRTQVGWQDGYALLPFEQRSRGLARCLDSCREAVIFAATVGLAPDRYIARQQRISPTKALLAQAFGAERAESLCDAFCREMQEEAAHAGMKCTPRFSPGYGDLPLETQRDICRMLDCSRKIGVFLSGSLLMTPSKSVTAVFGIK